MHLTIFSGDASIAVENNGGVMIKSRCTLLKQRGYQYYFIGRSQFGVKSGGRAGNRFRQIKQLRIFGLAEIQGVMQFLQNHQLGTVGGAGFYTFSQVHQVRTKV